MDEYRFTDPIACADAATQAYRNANPPDQTGSPTPVASNPLLYSIKAKDTDVEKRFVIVSADELNKYGDFITYREVNRVQHGNDKKDIDDAIEEFTQLLGDAVITGPFQDAADVNGKRPWRAVLQRKASSTSPDQARLLQQDDVYGIVVNPPYP